MHKKLHNPVNGLIYTFAAKFLSLSLNRNKTGNVELGQQLSLWNCLNNIRTNAECALWVKARGPLSRTVYIIRALVIYTRHLFSHYVNCVRSALIYIYVFPIVHVAESLLARGIGSFDPKFTPPPPSRWIY